MNKKILALAIPSIISNITVPLLGLVDVTIVGHLGSPLYIGAIAVGGMLFNMIYWLFAFLRMGTSGLTSQAYGRRDLQEVSTLFIRAMAVGLGIALLLILLQGPILHVAFSLINTTEDIRALATLYFRICIFGAPAMLGLYGFTGWFVGMQNSRFPMSPSCRTSSISWQASVLYSSGIWVLPEWPSALCWPNMPVCLWPGHFGIGITGDWHPISIGEEWGR